MIGVAKADAGHRAFTQHFLDELVQDELDLLVRAGAVDHDRRGAELLAAVDQDHLAGETGDEARLLHRGVAASDDHDGLVAEEGRVACGAVRDAAPLEGALRLEAELAGSGSRRDDHGFRAVLVVADPHAERPLREVDARHVVRQEGRAESLRLTPEVLHHRRAEDTVGVPRVVLHVGGDHQLATPVEALDDQRLEVRARGVERSGIAGGTSADHDQVADIVQGSAVLLCRVIPLMGETTTRSPVFQRSCGVRLAWKELRGLLGDELRSGEDTCLPLDGRQLRRRDPRDSVLLEAPRLGQHLPFERTDGLVERRTAASSERPSFETCAPMVESRL